MTASPLRAVRPDETEAPKPKTVAGAAALGDHLALMVATRQCLATAMDSPSCPPRDLAALSLRLLAVDREIEAAQAATTVGGAGAESRADEAFNAEAV